MFRFGTTLVKHNIYKHASFQAFSFSSMNGEWGFPLPVMFGNGRIQELPAILESISSTRPLIVTDRDLVANTNIIKDVESILKTDKNKDIHVQIFSNVDPNPTDLNIYEGAEFLRNHNADSVIAIGGGSGLDAGKAIAMVGYTEEALDTFWWMVDEPYDVAANNSKIPPVITIPTTSGTGAEMAAESMFTNTKDHVKSCVAHPDCKCYALLDPELTISLPPNLTAWTGMDALTHALEAFFVPDDHDGGVGFHPMCDGIALRAMKSIDKWLVRVYQNGADKEGRAHLLAASSMAAVAFHKGLGGVHGLSEPIGAVYNTQHGLTNAILLPYFLRLNKNEIKNKCNDIAQYLNLSTPPDTFYKEENESQDDDSSRGYMKVIFWVDELSKQCNIPKNLSSIVTVNESVEADGKSISIKAEANSTGFTNPIRLSRDDYYKIWINAMSND